MSRELELRFYVFAKRVRDFCRKIKRDTINIEYVKQLIRSIGSIGANYLEASDDLGKADEKLKIKIARRETKETLYWLCLILTYNDAEIETERIELVNEGKQIKKILSSILI